jgi:uncharacterized protein YcfL
MKKSHFKIIQTTVIPVVIISLSIGGCTSKSPAQIEDRHNMVFTKHGTMEVIRVYQNDTIESISQQKNIPIEIIAATNNLHYPYHLYNIRTIMIPKDRFHKVKKSESLKSILMSICNVHFYSQFSNKYLQCPFQMSIFIVYIFVHLIISI